MELLKELNKKLPTQWAFFGPLWFCWICTIIGFDIWFIEPTLKYFGLSEFALVHSFMNELINIRGLNLFFIIGILIMSFVIFCPLIYFPSFMFLFAKTITKPGELLKYILVLTSPITYNFLLEFLYWLRQVVSSLSFSKSRKIA